MKNITPIARDNIRKILYNSDNHEDKVVENQMMEVLRVKIKFTKKNLTLLKMTKLRQLRIGTSQVEGLAGKIENSKEVRCEKTVVYIMDRQIEKITEEVAMLKNEVFSRNKEAMKHVRMEWRKNRMKAVFKEETENVWNTEKIQMMKTIEIMKKKYRKDIKENKEDNCRGVVVCEDVSQDELETDRKTEKVVTEGIETTQDEEAYLRVPTKMADNCEFNKVKAMTDIQIMMAKVRMTIKRDEEDKEAGLSNEEIDRVREVEADARRVVDMSAKVVDFSKKKVTDMKTCRRITLPSPLSGDLEAKLKTLEGGLEGAVLREEKRVKTLGKKETQLTDQEVRGHVSIKEREKAGEGVLLSCDKSGKSSFVGKAPFIEKMEDHMNQDPIVSLKEVEKQEKVMSAMSCQLAKVLRIGENWHHQDRVQQAVRSEHTGVPNLDGMLKDHKGTEKLPVRPVCKSGSSPNGILSDLTSDILVSIIREMTDRQDTEERRLAGDDVVSDLGEIKSTEELQAKVQDCNDYINKRESECLENGTEIPQYVIGSNDVKALYPSCKTEESAKIVRKQVEQSQLDFNLNEMELALFIASTKTPEEIEEEGIRRFVHRRKNKKGGKPGITSECVTGSPEERRTAMKQMWRKPRYKPGREDKMKMLGIVVQTVIKKVMSCHYYKFGNTIRRQRDGGPIGLRLTGEVAAIRMLVWDKEARRRIKEAGAEEAMYGRYVDDVNHVYRILPDGSEYNSVTKKIEVNPDKMITDRNREKDEVTFEVIQNIVNSVDKDIQMTGDVPSQNLDKMVPVLDMGMYMADNRVVYTFYSKPMATRYLIPERSAHPNRIKRSTLIQEGVRRLLNVSPDLPDTIRTEVMSRFDVKMRFSGYNKRFRWNVLNSAYSIYESKLKEQTDGVRPLYRRREYQRSVREKKKVGEKEIWYRGDRESPNLAPLIIDPTPGGVMYKEMEKVIKDFSKTHKMAIKLVERGGRKLDSHVKSNPLGEKECGREKCSICQGEKPGQCSKPGAGYRQTCIDCQEAGVTATYEGETSRTAYQRGLEHASDVEKKSEDSPLWKHSTIHHESNPARFQMEVTGLHRSAMERLSNEIVRIKISNSTIVMNSKNDWAQPALVRVVAVTGNAQDVQAGDQLPSRQDRRAARGTPQRRRRRANSTSTPESSQRQSQRSSPSQRQGEQQDERESRRLRRGQ
jgi:hypothetical protein